MACLFEPLTLRGVRLRNRIGMAPMCLYLSDETGAVTDWHKVHLGARAIGGVGLVTVEATAVSPEGRVTPHDLGLWSDDYLSKFSELATFIEAQGSVPAIQLSHAGRKASRSRPWEGDTALGECDGGWPLIGPSPLAFASGYLQPRELEVAELTVLQKYFAEAARRARDAGFKMIELHAGHGRLLHSFYSPISNSRCDEYGGSPERRARFLVETVGAVRSTWPDSLPLAVRLSCTDWVEGGFELEDAVTLSRMLVAAGVDLIDCSSGGIVRPSLVKTSPGYQVRFAETIRHGAGVPTAAVGLITTALHAEEVLANGSADLILLGRELLRNPHWALDAKRELTNHIHEICPLPYLKGFTYDENARGHLAEL